MIPRPFRTAWRLARRTGRRRYRLDVIAAILVAGVGVGGLLSLDAGVAERYDVDLPVHVQPTAPATSGVVTGYRDGDTFLSTAGPIRIFQVEAPETKAHAKKCDDPVLADAAENALAELAPIGTVVGLRVTHESFDRHVAYVTLPDGTDLGDRLLATGTVTAYPSDGTCPGGAG